MTSERLCSLLLAALIALLLSSVGSPSFAQTHKRRPKSDRFQRCLPPDISSRQVAVYGGPGGRNVTVADVLTKLKAGCSKGRLLDSKKREIRFFKLTCWGHPPPNYQELQAEESRNLALLQASYTVIVIPCDPRIP
jgi:hypothetical protein